MRYVALLKGHNMCVLCVLFISGATHRFIYIVQISGVRGFTV